MLRTFAVALAFACARSKMLSPTVNVVKFQFSVVFLLSGKFVSFFFCFFFFSKELKNSNATQPTVTF